MSETDLLAMLLPNSPDGKNTLNMPHLLPGLSLQDEDFQHLRNYLPTDDDDALPVPSGMAENSKRRLSESPAHVQLATGAFAALSPIGRGDGDHCDKRQRRVPWTHTEDVTILALHRHMGTNWESIAAKLPGRTADAVRNRCFRLQKQHPIATSDEGVQALDGLLLATHGIEPPKPVAQGSDASTGSKAPARAHHAEHARQAWSADEDRIIVEGVQRLGCKWREIAKFLPGRTDSSIRNRWMRLQKEKYTKRQSGEESPAPKSARPLSAVRQNSQLGAAAAAAASKRPFSAAAASEPPVELPAVDATAAAALGSPPKLAAGEVPLGLDSPYMMLDLDSFAAIAFEAAGEGDDELTISEADLLDAPDGPVDIGDGAPAPTGHARLKLGSVLLGAFAAMSIGALASARKR